jgi:uncharacterized repeat protein (TIGR03803 family)
MHEKMVRSRACFVLLFASFAISSVALAGGGENVLYRFQGGMDGVGPRGPLIRDKAGNLYGTTVLGGDGTNCDEGSAGCGTVFKIAPDGTETLLHSFKGSCDGALPEAGLVADRNGKLYGTTARGGVCDETNGAGTVFTVASNGVESVLYGFLGGSDGEYPLGPLFLGKDGNLYGTTANGGGSPNCHDIHGLSVGCGTVFELVLNGRPGQCCSGEIPLYAFQGGMDGSEPAARVIMDKDGNIYGTTLRGGGTGCAGFGCGTVFKLGPDDGPETVLHAFQGGRDGASPDAGPVKDAAGNFYGTTSAGGLGYGTVFKITPTGTETVLYSFRGGTDGWLPHGGVILDRTGNLYGTTLWGGSTRCEGHGCGVAYELSAQGAETLLHTFAKAGSGRNPIDSLLFGKHDSLYGVAGTGGYEGNGLVFELKPN